MSRIETDKKLKARYNAINDINQTGFPNLDMNHLKYYPIEVFLSELPNFSIYELLHKNCWEYNNSVALIYYGREITYRELLDRINNIYPDVNLSNVEILKVAYVNASGLNVRNGSGLENDKIGLLKKYESILVLKEINGWYLILTNDGLIGFVDKNYTKELNGVFVIIDISEQKLWLYDDNEVLLSTSIVTGKDETPTNVGLFKIKNKETNRYLVGEDYYTFVNYWMPFDGGIGLHDATWRKKFGGNIYQKNGSHGCVNMPYSITDDIYEKVEKGTKVLVQK